MLFKRRGGIPITREDLRRYAASALEALKKEGIDSLEKIEKRIQEGQNPIVIDYSPHQQLLFDIGTVNLEDPAYRIIYSIAGQIRFPFQANIAVARDYAETIVNVNERIDGYDVGGAAVEKKTGNIRQYKKLREASVDAVKEELGRLSRI